MLHDYSRSDPWLSVALFALTFALLAHAGCPRYEYMVVRESTGDVIKIDRWTGENELMFIISGGEPPPTAAPGIR